MLGLVLNRSFRLLCPPQRQAATRCMQSRQMESVVKNLTNFLNSGFEIIMESDLVSLLFHCYLTEYPKKINNIHSDTRVFNSDGSHIDLVVGAITFKSKRPSIIPELLVECKIFGNGFTSSQLSKRFAYLKDDLIKLNQIEHKVPKYIIVYDYCNYLNDLREKELVQIRNNLNKNISIFIIYKQKKYNFKIL